MRKKKKKIASSFVDARILYSQIGLRKGRPFLGGVPVAGKVEGPAYPVLSTESSVPSWSLLLLCDPGTSRFNPPLPFIVSGGWVGGWEKDAALLFHW